MLPDGIHAIERDASQRADHWLLELGLLGSAVHMDAIVLLEHCRPSRRRHEVVGVEDDPVARPLELGRIEVERDQVEVSYLYP